MSAHQVNQSGAATQTGRSTGRTRNTGWNPIFVWFLYLIGGVTLFVALVAGIFALDLDFQWVGDFWRGGVNAIGIGEEAEDTALAEVDADASSENGSRDGSSYRINSLDPEDGEVVRITSAAFATLVDSANGDPYALIGSLDRHAAKYHISGPFSLPDPGDGRYVLWCGLYVEDDTFDDAVQPVLVDGQTGVWEVVDAVTIPATCGLVVVGNAPDFLGIAMPSEPATITDGQGCISKDIVVGIINANKVNNPNNIYVELDNLVNNAHTNARLRAMPDGDNTYELEALHALIWVQSGDHLAEGTGLALDSVNGKTLYLITSTGRLTVDYAHSGLCLCEDINPEQDFPWWGS